MKLMMLILSLSLTLILAGCGCDGEDPSVILKNNGTDKADIQVKTSDGNTENINNVNAQAQLPKEEHSKQETLSLQLIYRVLMILSFTICRQALVTITR